ncbi:acyl-ACP--UDP-N-acetylglucosamine O-acyltransferase [soil metagenome]
MSRIHPTAIVDPGAQVADDVEIGPFSIVGPAVRIGAGTRIGAHVVLSGATTLGRDNRIFHHCSIGEAPQDKKYAGEPTRLEIGDGNTIREFCTLNIGTVQGQGVTRVGSDNWIMAYVHVAHDCLVGDHTILANCTQLAGHVEIGDWVILGGLTGVHQYCRVGAHAMTGVATKLTQDVPPFVMAEGNPSSARGLNLEGMRRRGFDSAEQSAIKQAYRLLYRDGLLIEDARGKLGELLTQSGSAAVELFASFVLKPGRGLLR